MKRGREAMRVFEKHCATGPLYSLPTLVISVSALLGCLQNAITSTRILLSLNLGPYVLRILGELLSLFRVYSSSPQQTVFLSVKTQNTLRRVVERLFDTDHGSDGATFYRNLVPVTNTHVPQS